MKTILIIIISLFVLWSLIRWAYKKGRKAGVDFTLSTLEKLNNELKSKSNE